MFVEAFFRYFLATHAMACLCGGSGITFVENDSFVKLRSQGLANIGYIRSRDDDDYANKMTLVFRQLRFLTPANNDLFKTGSETFDIQPSSTHRHRNLAVHAMAMTLNIGALGVALAMKGAILKQDGFLRGVDVGLLRGDVIASLALTPTYDEQTCIACQVDVGHVIQLELDISHVGISQCRELREQEPPIRSYQYGDGSKVYIPEQIFVDGSLRRAEFAVSGSGNNHKLIVRLPAPLGQKMEVNIIFRTPKPPPPTTTPTTPVPHPSTQGRTDSEEISKTVKKGSRDQVNMAEDEPERRMMEVEYTTTRAPKNNGKTSKAIVAIQEQNINGSTRHSTSGLLVFLAIIIILAYEMC